MSAVTAASDMQSIDTATMSALHEVSKRVRWLAAAIVDAANR